MCERELMVSIEVSPLTMMIGVVGPKRSRNWRARISPLMSGRCISMTAAQRANSMRAGQVLVGASRPRKKTKFRMEPGGAFCYGSPPARRRTGPVVPERLVLAVPFLCVATPRGLPAGLRQNAGGDADDAR